MKPKVPKSRVSAIIDVFRQVGPCSCLRLAQECVARGVFTETELRMAGLEWARDVCREALKDIDPVTLLPFAGPTQQREPGAGPIWKQIVFMDFEELSFNIEERAKQLRQDYEVLKRLHAYCLERFGRAPEIPELRVPAVVTWEQPSFFEE